MEKELAQQLDVKLKTMKIVTSDEYVDFRLFKENRLRGKKEYINNEVSEHIVHISTLAQIVYEVLKGYELERLSVIPTIIVLNQNAVKGVSKEGIYFINLKKEVLIPLKNINEADWKYLNDESKSALAIGYLLKEGSHRDENIRDMLNEMSRVMELHGELTDSIIEKTVKVVTLPFSAIQWIKNKKVG